MKKAITYNLAFGCIMMFFCCALTAQPLQTYYTDNQEIIRENKRVDNYLELKNLGYKDREIFEDLGNVNFLTKNFETAVFWYKKLKDVSDRGILNHSYQQRYQYALEKTGAIASSGLSHDIDWDAMIREDYQIKKKSVNAGPGRFVAREYRTMDFQPGSEQLSDAEVLVASDFQPSDNENLNGPKEYRAPIAITADGKTAYFSKPVYVKPLYGIFSKKELVHKIYQADKVGGQWTNMRQVAVCPKNSSALHPAISADGKRLFFASDMPGSFGKYDIYVSAIHADGTLGVAKNLGEKVNTRYNDLYPNMVGTNTLFFASEGRKGYGGLDVFMTQVGHKKVGWSVNLGSPINSEEDDFSIYLMAEKGMGYVMSNRGKKEGDVQRVVFSYPDTGPNTPEDHRKYNLLDALYNDSKIDYSITVFEDE